MAAIGPQQAALYGLSMNENNGIYSQGYAFDVEKKLSVEASYQRFTPSHCLLSLWFSTIAHSRIDDMVSGSKQAH